MITGWNSSKIISPPNSDDCNVAILVQSSADFALTYNFQGTRMLGALRGHLCDSKAFLFYTRRTHSYLLCSSTDTRRNFISREMFGSCSRVGLAYANASYCSAQRPWHLNYPQISPSAAESDRILAPVFFRPRVISKFIEFISFWTTSRRI